MYHTLSCDGGGIRGVLQARLLERLEQRLPGFLSVPRCLAGASIGGINVLFLAAGRPVHELMDLYRQRAVDIFRGRGTLDYVSPDELWRADFAHEDIYRVLTDAFGDLRMQDLGRDVLIPVFDLRTWQPRFYSRADHGILVRDVARMTSAAPTFWPSHLWSLDGGLFANNPSDSVVAAMLKVMRQDGLSEGQLAQSLSCFSIGTGRVPHRPPSEGPTWDAGVLDAIPLILNVVMDGAVVASHYRTKQALNGRYFRLQPELPSEISLKDVDKLDELIQIADLEDLREAEEWVGRVWGKQPTAVEKG